MIKIKIKKIHRDVKVPSYAHPHDAGLDLYAHKAITITPMARARVSTGLQFEVPAGYVGLIWDKSGVSYTTGIKTIGGVLDAGFRGEVTIGVINLSDTPHTFEKGDKVAQLLIQKVEHVSIETVDTLEDSTRGMGSYGSTGK